MADTSTTETSEREALHMAYDALLDIQKMTGVVVAPSVLRRCYEALASQPVTQSVEPVAWRPIETAPKDGSEVWAFNGEQGVMHWTAGEIDGGKWALWVWADQLMADVDAEPDQPTHWMPLPAAPQPSVSQEAGK